MTAIIDYSVGNLFSLLSSLRAVGEEAVVTASPEELKKADRIILPGVGAFGDAALRLQSSGALEELYEQAEKGKPLLGICLGMQLLFEKGYEYGVHKGLGLLGGEVKPIEGNVKVPHMGWNALTFKKTHPLFSEVREGEYVYFVHSYAAAGCGESLVAVTDHGGEITAACALKNVMGCQFHPEKSGAVGMKILKAFCRMKEGDLC